MTAENHPSDHPNEKTTVSVSTHGDADAKFLVASVPQSWSHALPAVELLLASLPQQQGS